MWTLFQSGGAVWACRQFVMYLDDFIYFVKKNKKSGISTEILSNQHAHGVDFGRR